MYDLRPWLRTAKAKGMLKEMTDKEVLEYVYKIYEVE